MKILWVNRNAQWIKGWTNFRKSCYHTIDPAESFWAKAVWVAVSDTSCFGTGDKA
jgi:hypothetical protein